MKYTRLFTVFVFAILWGIFQISAAPGVTAVSGIPGPEDLVLDIHHGPPRLLISSTDRRGGIVPGQIYIVDVATGEVKPIRRLGEPFGFAFFPHGIDLVEDNDGTFYLYVINHWRAAKTERHGVARYRVARDALFFEGLWEDPLLVSPNDLAALPNGSIYVTNDSSQKGGMLELILGLRQSNVVYFDGVGWREVAGKIAMANGIAIISDKVYVAATRENRVLEYHRAEDGSLSSRRVLAKVKGPDNFSILQGNLIVAAHEKSIALSRHLSSSSSPPPSPTAIYLIDVETGQKKSIFRDSGVYISAGSVGVVYQRNLYIGQIMDPFIVSAMLDREDILFE